MTAKGSKVITYLRGSVVLDADFVLNIQKEQYNEKTCKLLVSVWVGISPKKGY